MQSGSAAQKAPQRVRDGGAGREGEWCAGRRGWWECTMSCRRCDAVGIRLVAVWREHPSIPPPQLSAVRGTEFGSSTLALNGHCYRPARLEDRTHGGGVWELGEAPQDGPGESCKGGLLLESKNHGP